MIRSGAAAAVIAVAVFLSWRDLTSDKGGQVVQASSEKSFNERDDESFADFKNSVPQPKMKSRMSGPTLKFMFCYS